jgi:hypothetical protein
LRSSPVAADEGSALLRENLGLIGQDLLLVLQQRLEDAENPVLIAENPRKANLVAENLLLIRDDPLLILQCRLRHCSLLIIWGRDNPTLSAQEGAPSRRELPWRVRDRSLRWLPSTPSGVATA